MTLQIEFTVPGDPRGKGRPRFSRVGKFTKTYTDAKTKMYEDKIASAARLAMYPHEPLTTPIAVWMHINVPIPASYSKKRKEACLLGLEMPCKKPDIDNVAKGILDAMNGIVYKDDVQVIRLTLHKQYSTEPSVYIMVREFLPLV
jgi:Holliday junction resolvase RusA-like endonuclease